jgi:hypothetical protein
LWTQQSKSSLVAPGCGPSLTGELIKGAALEIPALAATITARSALVVDSALRSPKEFAARKKLGDSEVASKSALAK